MDLIVNNFDNYFKNIEKCDNNNYKIKYLPHWRMGKDFYINKFYTDEITDENIYDLERFLIWNHHNMKSPAIITTFKRRITRVINYLNTEECILFYIDKIYSKNNLEEYIEHKIISVLNKYYKYNHKIIYIIPFTNKLYNDFDTKLYSQKGNLFIYLLKTTEIKNLSLESKKQNKMDSPLLDADHNDKNINWDKLFKNLHLP